MSIECFERVTIDEWVEIPCVEEGSRSVVTAWVEYDVLHFASFTLDPAERDTFEEIALELDSAMHVRLRIFVGVLRRVLEAQPGARRELAGHGRFDVGEDTITFTTNCLEVRVFTYDDLNAFYDWLTRS